MHSITLNYFTHFKCCSFNAFNLLENCKTFISICIHFDEMKKKEKQKSTDKRSNSIHFDISEQKEKRKTKICQKSCSCDNC